VSKGELLGRRQGPALVLSAEPGNVDVAVMGTANGGIAGEGRIAEVTFRVKRVGDPGLHLASVKARDAHNQEIALGSEITSVPLPERTTLEASFPNPFRNETSLRLALSKPGVVRLAVYDVQGRQVRQLLNGYQVAGQKVLRWDGADENGVRQAPGLYVIRMAAEGRTMTQRVALVR
jgi:hypothetical protein